MKPELIERFIRAVTKAGNYVLNNKEEVIYLLKKYIPTLSAGNLEINKKVLSASIDLWIDEDIETYGLGYTTMEDWRRSIDKMYSLGLIGRRIDAEQCFTNEFIGK